MLCCERHYFQMHRTQKSLLVPREHQGLTMLAAIATTQHFKLHNYSMLVCEQTLFPETQKRLLVLRSTSVLN